MQMVHEMLAAAMAEDGDGNDEDKEEAARKADEGIAMLKAKLEKAKASEAENEESPDQPEKDPEADPMEPEMKPDSNDHQRDAVAPEEAVSAPLKAKLEESEAKVNPPLRLSEIVYQQLKSNVLHLGLRIASRTGRLTNQAVGNHTVSVQRSRENY